MQFGLELPGRNAAWVFESDRIVINYTSSRGAPRLLRRLGKRIVPYTAIADAGVTRGDGPPVLSLKLRAGSDPYTEAAASQLPEDSELYCLEVDPDRYELAEYYADHIRSQIELNPEADQPASAYLLDAEDPPLQLKGWDGEAYLDEHTVRFRWNLEATFAKSKHGDRTYRLAELDGVDWVRPRLMSGHLALRPRNAMSSPKSIEDDPNTLLFGLGLGNIADSLPFAAALLVGIQREQRRHLDRLDASPPQLPPAGQANSTGNVAPTPQVSTPQGVASAIRELADLHQSGLITQEEFERKKTELLDRL
ncbi:DUF4429 domain-containing protein [Saccharomonospora viridis]|jgi:hypothetical protein|uniref:DUF4429 domain-containing protein n=1 Tax=Saccharomonospora viridis TaxID=1852 RepID=UPI00240940A0|nr:DUF4429 domain-containing protein [Saccharomonospora viridis]